MTDNPGKCKSDDPIWSNRFHWCAIAAGFIAHAEERINDSRYVQKLAYELYESGAFRNRVAPSSSPASLAVHPTGLSDPGS